MNVINLSYSDNKNYYDLYIDNNFKLKNLIEKNIKSYNFEYNPEKYYQLDNDVLCRNIYENFGMIIMLNSIIEKNIYGYCIKTQKKYMCQKMSLTNHNVDYIFYAYHFNIDDENEFIIYFSWEYFSPFIIYYPKIKYIYNINYRKNNVFEHIDLSKDSYNVLKYIDFDKTIYVKQNYISYMVGIIPNSGHSLWNEVMGLMFIIENNLLDNIDEILIYKYDYFNVGEILKNKFNKKIIYIENKFNHNAFCILTKHFIDCGLIEKFKNIYDIRSLKKNEPEKKKINVLFDIRTNSRTCLNQEQIIIETISELKHYENICFHICGFYKNNNFKNNMYNIEDEVEKQNAFFELVQCKFDFKINNLINKDLIELLGIVENFDLFVTNMGSGISFLCSILFNSNIVAFTCKKNIRVFDEQKYAFETKLSNTRYVDSLLVVDDKNDDFYIDSNKLLDKILLTLGVVL